MKIGNIYAAVPQNLPEEVFQTILTSNAIKIERIISKGHISPDTQWYDQDQHEWVIVLRGRARLAFQDEPSVYLNSGDYLNIPAHKKHRVEWTDPATETIWLAVHY